MAKIRLKSNDKRVQAEVIVCTDPKQIQFSCDPEKITIGSSAGPVVCPHGLQVQHDGLGPYCYASPEQQAALSAAGLLA